jgi:hypothetical protein
MDTGESDSRAQVHARLLRGWMGDKGLKAPSLALSVEKQGQQISPDYIRKLTRGERELASMPLELREAVRRALRVSANDWEDATGLATAADIDPDPLVGFPTPLYRKRDEVYVPEGLLEAIKLFGDVPEYADLKLPDVQRQLANHRGFDGGPQTAGQWLAFFQANKPWITSKD